VGVEQKLKDDVSASPRHALLYAQIAFARAVLSLSASDAEDALGRCWQADAIANEFGGAGSTGGVMSAIFGAAQDDADTDVEGNLERQLVKADAHLMGAVLQLLLGMYLRAPLNFRAGWNLYHAAADTLETSPQSVPSRLKCVIDFGVGMFHLVISLLPRAYLAVAEYVGFGGDRAEAKRLLTRAYEADETWSPFPGLLLLYFYTQLSPNLGIFNPADKRDIESLLAGPVAQRHKGSALFLWMEGMAARLYHREPERASHKLTAANDSAQPFPALQQMVLNDVAWTHLEAFAWGDAASTFERLLRLYVEAPSAQVISRDFAAVC
jgi:hypothetical protein